MQSYYGATTVSNLFILGFDTLDWIKTKTDDKYAIVALKNENNELIFERMPIKKLAEINHDFTKKL